MWTIESIEARRRETGDGMVTVADWAVSFTTSSHAKGSVLSCFRMDRTYTVIERDPRDGETFETSEIAECYALNAGRLQWWHDTETYRAMMAERAARAGVKS